MKGGLLFLEAVGFKQQLLPHEGAEEQFYVYEGTGEEEGDDQERLSSLEELLQSCQPLKMALERGLTVYRATSRAHHFDLPSDFYNLTLEEIKREQKIRCVSHLCHCHFCHHVYHWPLSSAIIFVISSSILSLVSIHLIFIIYPVGGSLPLVNSSPSMSFLSSSLSLCQH